MSSTSGPVIRCERVVKRFGDVIALDGLDLTVERGTVVGYLGPNGAGKSTTIRILLDLARADSGEVEVLGSGPRAAGPGLRRRIGYLPGELRLDDRLRVDETLRSWSALRGGVDADYVDELCERFDLDPLVQAQFLMLVDEARSQGRTVFLSSHVLSEVQRLADEVVVIRAGRVVARGDLDRLRQRALQPFVVWFADAAPIDELRSVPGIDELQVLHATEVQGVIEGGPNELIRVLAGHDVVHVLFPEPDLEQAFLEYYEDDRHGRPQGNAG